VTVSTTTQPASNHLQTIFAVERPREADPFQSSAYVSERHVQQQQQQQQQAAAAEAKTCNNVVCGGALN